MKTNLEAANSGIDEVGIVTAGLYEFVAILKEYGDDLSLTLKIVRDSADILDANRIGIGAHTPQYGQYVSGVRAQLIEVRDGLLSANQFNWTVLCTHAIWWLSSVIDDV